MQGQKVTGSVLFPRFWSIYYINKVVKKKIMANLRGESRFRTYIRRCAKQNFSFGEYGNETSNP